MGEVDEESQIMQSLVAITRAKEFEFISQWVVQMSSQWLWGRLKGKGGECILLP